MQEEEDSENEYHLFQAIEQALDEPKRNNDNQIPKSSLAEDFPGVFIQKKVEIKKVESKQTKNSPQLTDIMIKLQEGLKEVEKEKQKLELDRKWIEKEKKEMLKNKTQVEKDKTIVKGKLQNEELLILREKYKELEKRFQTEQLNWQSERQTLLLKIQELTDGGQPLHPKKPFKSPEASKANIPKSSSFDTNLTVLHPNYELDFSFNPVVTDKKMNTKSGRTKFSCNDGSSGIEFKHGTKKVKKGKMYYVFHQNGDVGIEFPDGAKAMKFKANEAIELTLPDSTLIRQFANGQKETHYPNHDLFIVYPNNQTKLVHPNGDYEIKYPNGKIEKMINGKMVITTPD